MKEFDGELVYTTKDISEIKSGYHTGDRISFETLIFKSMSTLNRVKVTGTVLGVYPFGIECGFYHRTWNRLVHIKIFFSYAEIIQARMANKPLLASRGRNEWVSE